MTAKGTGFVIVATLVFLAGRITVVGWLYLVDAVLWGIIGLSVITPWLVVALTRAQRRIDQSSSTSTTPGPSEGDSLTIEISLQNLVFIPRFLLTLFYHCPLAAPGSQLSRFFVAQLPGSGQVSLESTVVAHKRGLHHLGPVVVESSAPFGLFRRRVQRTLSQSVLVYPKVHPLRRLALVEALTGSSAHPRKSVMGMDPVGARHYFPGDPRRNIHWRHTARLGRPMVKEFEEPKDPTLDLLFDATKDWGEGKDTTLEYAIKIVASAADFALRNRGSVTVWGGRFHGETAGSLEAGELEWPGLLESLALVEAGDGAGLIESLGQLPSGASALVVVNADDLQAIRFISSVAPTLHRLAVVVMDGFAGQGTGDSRSEYMRLLPGTVIRCRPGELSDTLHDLESLGEPVLSQQGNMMSPPRPA